MDIKHVVRTALLPLALTTSMGAQAQSAPTPIELRAKVEKELSQLLQELSTTIGRSTLESGLNDVLTVSGMPPHGGMPPHTAMPSITGMVPHVG